MIRLCNNTQQGTALSAFRTCIGSSLQRIRKIQSGGNWVIYTQLVFCTTQAEEMYFGILINKSEEKKKMGDPLVINKAQNNW